jgi:hypothetical protein
MTATARELAPSLDGLIEWRIRGNVQGILVAFSITEQDVYWLIMQHRQRKTHVVCTHCAAVFSKQRYLDAHRQRLVGMRGST